ncbi:MAG: hypothetical protein IT355_05100 [Gemmatimonadaceae bacterium]|nr:hypothetical protein [Gemmatimonadaceae bacterium]
MRRTAPLVLSTVAFLASAPSVAAQVRAAAAAPAATTALAPRAMPTGRYEFTRTDDDGDVTTGAVVWSGQQLRIDLDRNRNRSRRGNANAAVSNRRGEYTLVDFATSTVRTVKPEEREISEMPLATFEQIIGKALGMVGSVVQMQVRDAGILAKEVGPGGQVAGVATEQFRVIEEYNVRIGVFGMNAEEKHHRVVTDYWVPTEASLPRNPLFELLMRSASAVAQQDAVHQVNVSRARSALFRGAPVKVVVTVHESGEAQKRSAIEITSLTPQVPDAALFAVPAGYRVKKNDLSFSL